MLLPGFSRCPSRASEAGNDRDAQSLQDSVLVLTVASVIEPFLSVQHKIDISQVGGASYAC